MPSIPKPGDLKPKAVVRIANTDGCPLRFRVYDPAPPTPFCGSLGAQCFGRLACGTLPIVSIVTPFWGYQNTILNI